MTSYAAIPICSSSAAITLPDAIIGALPTDLSRPAVFDPDQFCADTQPSLVGVAL